MANKTTLGLILACLVTGCTIAVEHNLFRSIDPEGWRRGDTLVFMLPSSAQAQDYDVYVELRIDNSFPYRELWIGIEKQAGGQTSKDTICFSLADEDGTLNGQGLHLLQYEEHAGHIRPTNDEKATISIHHLMEREIIPHICEVGVRVECR